MSFNPDQPRVPAGSSAGGEFGKDASGTSRPTDGDLIQFKPLKTTGGDSAFKDFVNDDPELAADYVAINEYDRGAFEKWAENHSATADAYDQVQQEQNDAVATLEDGTVLHALSDVKFDELSKAGIPGVTVKRLGQDEESLTQMFDDLSTKETPIPIAEAKSLSGFKTRSKDFQPLAKQVKDSLYLVHYPGENGRSDPNDAGRFQFHSADELEKMRSDFAKSHPDFFKKGK